MAKKTGKSTSRPQPKQLPNVFSLTKTAALIVWHNRRILSGIVLVYGLLNFLFVQGLALHTDTNSLKDNLNTAFGGQLSPLATGVGVLAVLISSNGSNSSQAAGIYQFWLTIIASLAIIWALRQLLTGTKIKIRDAYYKGMYPLVPFILVLLFITLQLLPLLIGTAIYSTIVSVGIAASVLESVLWALFFAFLAGWSLYMISVSVFALYIVTLPDMTPRTALRSAKQLVGYRRWAVLRKLLWLPVVLLIIAAVIMVPIIAWLTPIAQVVFFALTMFMLLAAHTYIYTVYREVL